MLDVFSNNAAFEMASLTSAINMLPSSGGFLRSMNLFENKPITTTHALVEERNGILTLVQTTARGTNMQVPKIPPRKKRSLVVPHLALFDTVLADGVQNIRAFGSETLVETVSSLVNERMETMKANIEETWEYHMAGALRGEVLDADGVSVIYNLFTEFNVTQETVDFDMQATGTQAIPMKQAARTLQRTIGSALGSTSHGPIIVLAGDDWFDAFVAHDEVKGAFEAWNENSFARTQQDGPQGFEIWGLRFINYRASLGGTPYMPVDEAIAFPTGVRGLFQRILAPADYEETVNTLGKPFYAKQERMEFDRGRKLECQSNPLHICNRPKALVKVTATLPA